MIGRLVVLCLVSSAVIRAQVNPALDALVAILKPVLPYPAAAEDGVLPAQGGAESKWFVIWPSEPQDVTVTVRANPLHPDTQKAGAAADGNIQQAVAQAQRKMQAAYDRALAELRRTGKAGDVDGITLEDEGAAGERIDAELEATIALQAVGSYEISSAEEPVVRPGPPGAVWVVSVRAGPYQAKSGSDLREHFQPAETRLYFGAVSHPSVHQQGDNPRYRVDVQPSRGAFVVVVRGNEELVEKIVAGADWSRLARPTP